MKKFGKLAVLAAMILALACFVSCKHDSDDDSDSSSGDNNNTQQNGGNGGTYANTTWTTTAYVNDCTGKFTLTFDDKNGFVFAEKWSSKVWPVGTYPNDGSMSGTYTVEATKLVLTVTDTSNHGGGPTEDYNVGDTFELQISGDKLHYEAEDDYGSYTFTKSNNTQTGDDTNESDNDNEDPVTPPKEPETNENVVATYVCEEPQGSDEDSPFSHTIKFYNDGKFSVIYKGKVTGEVSKGSYTGDPTKDGDIVFKVENYVDKMYVALLKQFKWENKTIEDQTVTITGGKGEFNVWHYGQDEYTRQ